MIKNVTDMKKLSIFAVALLVMTGCRQEQSQTEINALHKVDSLSQIVSQKDNEINDMMNTFGEIENGFRQITEAQDRVAIAKQGEGTSSAQRIRENIQFIQNTMKQNKELINKLKQQLRESSVKGDALRKLIENMQTQLDEKEQQLMALRETLDEKELKIMGLDEQVANLNTDVKNLNTENTQRQETINAQDKQLHTAWFVFGTKKELKEQQILVDGKVLQSSFNKEYFTKIDIRVDKEVKLYSRKVQMLTSHPSGSYTLQPDANKQYVLRITDPQAFWSASKYLVVLVK
jgi:chromosome segregation ATPase